MTILMYQNGTTKKLTSSVERHRFSTARFNVLVRWCPAVSVEARKC